MRLYRFEICDMNGNHITFYAVRAVSLEQAKLKTATWLHNYYPSRNLSDLQIHSLL